MSGTSEISVPFSDNCNALRAWESMACKVTFCFYTETVFGDGGPEEEG